MPRFPQNMRERAIGMLQAGMCTFQGSWEQAQGQLDASEKGLIPLAKPRIDREADVRE